MGSVPTVQSRMVVRGEPPRPDLRGFGCQDCVRTGQASVKSGFVGPGGPQDRLVIEDLVAVVVGLALLAYLGYALARPNRF